jgi:hypothetical protein
LNDENRAPLSNLPSARNPVYVNPFSTNPAEETGNIKKMKLQTEQISKET